MPEMQKKRFHMLSLPHTITSEWWSTCAFTTKVFKLTEMLMDLGHEVIHYGNKGNEARCSEDVIVMDSLAESYDLEAFKEEHVWDSEDDFHKEWFKKCSIELNKRLRRKDFILCPWGIGHMPVINQIYSDILHHVYIVESGIGYPAGAQFAPYRVYESNAHLALSYGFRKGAGMEADDIPRKTDIVIANVYNPNDFIFSNTKEDYILFFGRVLKTKGTHVIAEILEARPDLKIKIAGQYKEYTDNIPPILRESENVEIIGYVDNEERAKLLSKAKCLICPTEYVEAFGGVAVEAQLSGTPVLASAWGAFNETIWHGQTGFLCRNVHQYLRAIDKVHYLDSTTIKRWAVENYSLERGKRLYDEYFEMLYTHKGSLTLYDKLYPLPSPEFIPSIPIHPITVSNIDDKDAMKYLNATCPNVEVLGIGKEFSFINKIKYVYEHLLTLPQHSLAIFTDAYDVFYLDDLDTIRDKFQMHQCDILWSTEKSYCHQLKEDQQFYDDMASTFYRYINTGTFMGFVGPLIKLYEDILRYIEDDNFVNDLNKPCWGNEEITDNCTKGYKLTDKYVDQTVVSHLLAMKGLEEYNMKLDYNCDIFYIPSVDWDYWMGEQNQFYYFNPDNRIRLYQTASTPSIIHVPAKSLGRGPLLDSLYNKTR